MATDRNRWWSCSIGLIALALGILGCGRDGDGMSSGGSDRLMLLDWSKSRPEVTASGGLVPTPTSATFAGLIGQLKRAIDHPSTKGYLLRFGSTRLNWAQVEELVRLGQGLRRDDRPVYCHADELNNGSYWLSAAVCDQIWLSPAGGVDGIGIAGQSLYLKGLLDRYGVQADFLHMGKYKSAAETFTRQAPSPASSEAMGALLSSIRDSWIAGLNKVRPSRDVAHAMEQGPWTPSDALSQGLIDHLGYESDAREALKSATGADGFMRADGKDEHYKEEAGFAQLVEALAGGEPMTDPHVAVLTAAGGITMDSDGGFSSEGIAARQFIKEVKRLKKDDSVKAVVLRIDSPGGSALASDLMWHELMQLREEKPLIASVGSMAASGGYYMACAAHTVIAEKTSIVGSIGVVGGKIMFGDALAEYGVNAHTFAASDEHGAEHRAAYLSPFLKWDGPTREKVRRQMSSIYDLFIDRIAAAREMDEAKVEVVAQGRVWTGAQGKEHGLVDELGGLRQAITLAKEKAGLEPDAPYTIEDGTPSFLEALGLGASASEAAIRAALARAKQVTPAWAPLAGSQGFLSPLLTRAEISHLQSLVPLLKGDSAVLALPFSVRVH